MRDRCLMVRELVSMHDLMKHYGIELKRGRCACPIHGGDNPTAFFITREGKGYQCNTGGCKGDVIAFVKHMEKLQTIGQSVEWLEAFANINDGAKNERNDTVKERSVAKQGNVSHNSVDTEKRASYSSKPSKVWAYTDKAGDTVFEVKRFEKIEGSGRGPDKVIKPYTNSKPGLRDADRCLYNLHLIVGSGDEPVFICEGEKTAEAMEECGYISTTNPMGSGQWKPEYGYAADLADKHIIICPDSDEESIKWVDAIKNDLCGKVKSIRILPQPDWFIQKHPEFKGHDFADMLQENGVEGVKVAVNKGLATAVTMPYGIEPGIIVTPNDAFNELCELHLSGEFELADFNKFVRGLDVCAHASDLVVVQANTGVGKTRALMNIASCFNHINSMLFDLELGRGIAGLRYASMRTGIPSKVILKMIKEGRPPIVPPMDYIFLDNTGGIDISYVRKRVDQVEQITQKKITCTAIDYVGLMRKKGGNASRYGALSDNIEEFKAYLGESGMFGIATTQVSRPQDKKDGYFERPGLFDSKDSGSVENSAQLLVQLWRYDQEYRNKLRIGIGKYSHGEIPIGPEDDGGFNMVAVGLELIPHAEWSARQVENNKDSQEEITF